jgi:hypothetical protein
MRYSIIFVAASAAVATAAGTVDPGQPCNSNQVCKYFVNCSSANTDLQRLCNHCVSGVCATPDPAATSASTSAAQAATPAPAGSRQLGDTCTSDAECTQGVACHAFTSDPQALCGNTGATCKTNDDCAFNACGVAGLCSGPPKTSGPGYGSSAASASTSTSTSALASGSASTVSTVVAAPTYNPTSNSTWGGATPSGAAPGHGGNSGSSQSGGGNSTTPITPSTGSGSVAQILSGASALVFGIAAYLL